MFFVKRIRSRTDGRSRGSQAKPQFPVIKEIVENIFVGHADGEKSLLNVKGIIYSRR